MASTSFPISSTYNLPLPPAPRPVHAVLTKSDLALSQAAYSTLLSTAKAYRLALQSLSLASSSFGSALEACARLKEARSEALSPPGGSLSNSFTARGSCTADSLLSASGVHQLIANHQLILSECVYRSFEVPLLHELDQWNRHIEEEEETYQREARTMSKEIQRLEKEGLKLHKQRKRDVAGFRGHLVQLTTKLDGLTTLHGGHARTLLRDSQETSARIVDASSSLVRAEVDIFEALARKGWSGGGLEDLLERGKDLFANENELTNSDHQQKMFSILPQGSILASGTEGRNDSDGETIYQSLGAAIEGRGDNVSIFSERGVDGMKGVLNRSRGVRTFSPGPSDRVVVGEDPLEERTVPLSRPDTHALPSIDFALERGAESQQSGSTEGEQQQEQREQREQQGEEEEEDQHVKRSVAEVDRGRERRWSGSSKRSVSE